MGLWSFFSKKEDENEIMTYNQAAIANKKIAPRNQNGGLSDEEFRAFYKKLSNQHQQINAVREIREKREVEKAIKETTSNFMQNYISNAEKMYQELQDCKQANGGDKSEWIKKNVPGLSGFYCIGSLTAAMKPAQKEIGSEFMPASSYNPRVSCIAAIDYMEKNDNPEMRKAIIRTGQESVYDVVKNNPNIKPGAICIVKADANSPSSSGWHAIMFAGRDENGNPGFLSFNNEYYKNPDGSYKDMGWWTKQKNCNCAIINVAECIEIEQKQKAQELGTRNYLAEFEQRQSGGEKLYAQNSTNLMASRLMGRNLQELRGR